MAGLHETAASLRFIGDDLDPDEITARLGAAPTRSVRKGSTRKTKQGADWVERTGSWHLRVSRRRPGDLDGQIAELLGTLSGDLSVWQDLTRRFRADIFAGLFMQEWNEGLSRSPA